jgi:uncharacterized ferritin-like protein (DUF455 family)
MSPTNITVAHFTLGNRRVACLGVWYRDHQAHARWMEPKAADAFIRMSQPDTLELYPSCFDKPRMRRHSLAAYGDDGPRSFRDNPLKAPKERKRCGSMV